MAKYHAGFVMNDVQEYEVKNQATEETHDLTWKTPPM